MPMATIKQKGVPTRNINASIGDTYIDLDTGNKYECIFAYRSGGSSECDWKMVKKGSGIKEVIKKVMPEVTTPVVEEVKEEVVEAEPVAEETPVQQPKKTNYTQYSKKK